MSCLQLNNTFTALCKLNSGLTFVNICVCLTTSNSLLFFFFQRLFVVLLPFQQEILFVNAKPPLIVLELLLCLLTLFCYKCAVTACLSPYE